MQQQCATCSQVKEVELTEGKLPLTQLPRGWVSVAMTTREGRSIHKILCGGCSFKPIRFGSIT